MHFKYKRLFRFVNYNSDIFAVTYHVFRRNFAFFHHIVKRKNSFAAKEGSEPFRLKIHLRAVTDGAGDGLYNIIRKEHLPVVIV